MAKKVIDENQHKYLSNLAAGKNPDGSAASAGNAAWAKNQLAASSYTPKANEAGTYAAALGTVKGNAGGAAVAEPTAVTPAVQPVNQPFQFKAPDPFSYDPNSDPAYQSALATAKANINQQQADTNARLRASGQGKSSYSESVANQIGAKEMGRITTEVLPALIDRAYAQYVDKSNRDLQVQQANYGVQRDDASDAFTKAQLTGTYLDPEAERYINAIIDLGRQWQNPNSTPEQKAAYHAQANEYRAALRGMGVDPSLFGANVSTEDRLANVQKVGVDTLAAQQFAYQEARDKIMDDRYKQQFDEDVRRYGLEFGLKQAMQAHQISADNAQIAISRMNAGTSRMNANLNQQQFAWSKDPDNPDNIYRNLQIDQMMNPPGAKAEDYFQSLDESVFLSPETIPNPLDPEASIRTGRTIVNDKEGLEKHILSLRLPDEEARKLYYRYGLKWGE